MSKKTPHTKQKSESEMFEETRKRIRILRTRAAWDILWDNRDAMYATWQRAIEMRKIIMALRNVPARSELSPKSKSMLNLLNYLGYVESIGVSTIDIGLMLLIANRKEVHISRGWGIRHVSKLRELQKVDLSYKLHFLKANGLDHFAMLIDRNLRNDIAHLKFEIDEDGTIRGSRNNVVKIDDVIRQFLARVDCIGSIFDDVKLMDWLMKPDAKEGSQ